MVNFISTGDSKDVSMVLSGDAIVVLAETPVVVYKNTVELMSESFDFGGFDVTNCTQKELDDYRHNIYSEEQNTIKETIKKYKNENHIIKHTYNIVVEKNPFTVDDVYIIMLHPYLSDNLYNGRGVDFYIDNLQDYPHMMHVSSTSYHGGQSFKDHTKYITNFVTKEYVLPCALEYFKFAKDSMIKAYELYHDKYVELANRCDTVDRVAMHDIYIDDVRATGKSYRENFLPTMDRVYAYDTCIAECQRRVLALQAKKEATSAVEQLEKTLNIEVDYLEGVQEKYEKETSAELKAKLQEEIESQKADISIIEQRLAAAQLKLEQATAEYDEAENFFVDYVKERNPDAVF